jgi:tetratricopeptide (TPR) repeat protein
MELDLELDRLGGPDTEGKSFAELTEAGAEANDRGYLWQAYAYSRDAMIRAACAPLRERYRDVDEQNSLAMLNTSTMASGLGRNRFALHEALHVLASNRVSPVNHARVSDRVASIYRKLGLADLADHYSDLAIQEAEAGNDRFGLAFMYSTKAYVALSRPDPQSAIALFHKSHSLHRDLGQCELAASVLVSIAECHLELERVRAAHQACDSALRMLQSGARCLAQASALAVLGKVVDAEGHSDRANSLWHEAMEVAKDCRDRVLKFKIELLLLRRALRVGDSSSARAIQRRMRRVSPWIPAELKELTEFRDLVRTMEVAN